MYDCNQQSQPQSLLAPKPNEHFIQQVEGHTAQLVSQVLQAFRPKHCKAKDKPINQSKTNWFATEPKTNQCFLDLVTEREPSPPSPPFIPLASPFFIISINCFVGLVFLEIYIYIYTQISFSLVIQWLMYNTCAYEYLSTQVIQQQYQKPKC